MYSMVTWMHLPAGGSTQLQPIFRFSKHQCTWIRQGLLPVPGGNDAKSVKQRPRGQVELRDEFWACQVPGLPVGNLLKDFLCRDKRDYLAVYRFRQEQQAHPGSCNWRVTADNKTLHEGGSYASNFLVISGVIFKSLLVKREFLFQESSAPQGLQPWRSSTKANDSP